MYYFVVHKLVKTKQMSDGTLDALLHSRCTQAEKDSIIAAAKASKRSYSDYIRLVMLEAVKAEKTV